jgi:hypothetical protein
VLAMDEDIAKEKDKIKTTQIIKRMYDVPELIE